MQLVNFPGSHPVLSILALGKTSLKSLLGGGELRWRGWKCTLILYDVSNWYLQHHTGPKSTFWDEISGIVLKNSKGQNLFLK